MLVNTPWQGKTCFLICLVYWGTACGCHSASLSRDAALFGKPYTYATTYHISSPNAYLLLAPSGPIAVIVDWFNNLSPLWKAVLIGLVVAVAVFAAVYLGALCVGIASTAKIFKVALFAAVVAGTVAGYLFYKLFSTQSEGSGKPSSPSPAKIEGKPQLKPVPALEEHEIFRILFEPDPRFQDSKGRPLAQQMVIIIHHEVTSKGQNQTIADRITGENLGHIQTKLKAKLLELKTSGVLERKLKNKRKQITLVTQPFPGPGTLELIRRVLKEEFPDVPITETDKPKSEPSGGTP